MDAAGATQDLLTRVRARPWGAAFGAARGTEVDIVLDAGDDALTECSRFQFGSITKTMAGVILADAVLAGELALDTQIGEVLPVTGLARSITLQQLATHHSGLPRLPANLDLTTVDRADPYAAYTADDLLAAVDEVEPADPTEHTYSNFGFMLLGHALAAATGTPMADLLRTRIFEPLGMADTGCPSADDDGRLPGYADGRPTPWWSTNLPGAGGVGGSLGDLLRYAMAHLDPDSTSLGPALALATTIHTEEPNATGLGWGHLGGGWFHDGATGGFSSFVGFFRPTMSAVAVLANTANLALTRAGLATLTAMARS